MVEPSSKNKQGLHKETLDVVESLELRKGQQALKEAGMPKEFAKCLRAVHPNSCVIHRAGDPPPYDRPRRPKRGVNLSKTAKGRTAGFLSGSIPDDPRFMRLGKDGKPIKHHAKDLKALKNRSLVEGGGQHTQALTQLPIRLSDIVFQLRDGGSMEMISYDKGHEIRFRYREGCSPPGFEGDMVIKLNEYTTFQPNYSREQDKPDKDVGYDTDKKIITKPPFAEAMSDKEWNNFYKECKHREYPLYMTSEPDSEKLEKCKVFSEEEDKPETITVGDFDGLMVGHPTDLPEEFYTVYNTFSPDADQKKDLKESSEKLLNHYKSEAEKKPDEARSPLEKFILNPSVNFEKIIGSESHVSGAVRIDRAGCVTPYEFLNMQMVNYAYSIKESHDLRDPAKMVGLEKAILDGLTSGFKVGQRSAKIEHTALEAQSGQIFQTAFEKALESLKKARGESQIPAQIVEHLKNHLKTECDRIIAHHTEFDTSLKTLLDPKKITKITHPDFDMNIQDLYQHGYDNRNPYGCNFEGPWVMNLHGETIGGDNEDQLVAVLLSDDILKDNHMDCNFSANMEKWSPVIEKQIQLGQNVPVEVLAKWAEHLEMAEGSEPRWPDLNSIETITEKDDVLQEMCNYGASIKQQILGKSDQKNNDLSETVLEKIKAIKGPQSELDMLMKENTSMILSAFEKMSQDAIKTIKKKMQTKEGALMPSAPPEKPSSKKLH